ncbi:hypothetical protein [Alienimonas chondri]|uniref:Tetratricopeptide repeat protein n=1 Tax=Alienimonas chondri TaxID=2681879 RepID=A0ABX1VAV7_9PLAN|nr:hypothetical protein [Alienimonas chondri]NNJ24874.1 hypothetical protein [Alienimonas chondri]
MPDSPSPAPADRRDHAVTQAVDPDAPAPGPPKPGGIPGKYIVIGVAIGSLLITAGFTAVKFMRGDPNVLNRSALGYSDGLGALERIAMFREGIAKETAAGNDEEAVALQKREQAEWKIAEQSFAESISTGIVRTAAVGWLAEVKRRNGELSEAERLFDQALGDRPPPQSINAEALMDESAEPDPADYGGRALVRFKQGNRRQAAVDAQRALKLFDAGVETRARDVWTVFAPDRAELERIAAAGSQP